MRYLLIILSSFFLLTTRIVFAAGDLNVVPTAVSLTYNHNKTVTVKNLGDNPLYLSISLDSITNPGLTPEETLSLKEVSDPKLIVSPNKLTLAAGQKKTINLVALKAPMQEEIYRLRVIPVSSLKVNTTPNKKDTIEAPVSVEVGYGVLVRLLPTQQTAAWKHQCVQQNNIELINTGNVRQVFNNVTFDKNDLVKHPSLKNSNPIALFPGFPQVFPTKRMSFSIDNKTYNIKCP